MTSEAGTSVPRWAPCLGLALVFAAPSCTCGKRESPGASREASAPAVKPRAPAAAGELPVDLAKSKLTLSIIKDRDTKSPVTATLGLRDGAIALDKGTARLSVDLDAFESGIPIRNERVRGIFFETSGLGWDSAELTIPRLPDAALAALRDSKGVTHAKVDGDLKVHGHTSKATLTLDAGYGPGGALWVRSAEPIEVKISDLGLTENLKRLSSVCMHDSIDDVVKVEASLEFPPVGR